MNKTQIIQSLIDYHGFKSYCEIGLGDGTNFMAIKCDVKDGVDPIIPKGLENQVAGGTSDAFFNLIATNYDLIFLDGNHVASQVEKDVVNAWKFTNPGGMILIHDIKPHNEVMQLVPRQSKQWTGDVWRVWSGLKKTKLNLEYIDEEYGIGVIKKSRHKLTSIDIDNIISFQEYQSSKGWLIST
jgi:hypothetical protein